MIARAFFQVFSLHSRLPRSPLSDNAQMSLTPHDVENIARLARLAITPAERASLSDNLPKILTFVEQLSAAQTADVEPMAHPLDGQSQRLRSDTVSETDAHELFQQNAARVEAGLYLVPKVIE